MSTATHGRERWVARWRAQAVPAGWCGGRDQWRRAICTCSRAGREKYTALHRQQMKRLTIFRITALRRSLPLRRRLDFSECSALASFQRYRFKISRSSRNLRVSRRASASAAGSCPT